VTISIQHNMKGKEKKDIALVQLRTSVQLFNKSDFICSATLAGAAEEILGKIAKKRSGTNALEGDEYYFKQLAEMHGKPPPNRKQVIEKFNRFKNQLKHNDSGENEYISADYEFEAQDLIDRAIRNYLLAYGEFPKDRVVRNYVNFHWL